MVEDVVTKSRFELEEGGAVAFADYHRANGVLEIRHVEAPLSLRGTGAAGRLMDGVIAKARLDGERIRPICSYAAAYMRRRSDARDLLA
jgi:predicted GNAT family acetyltransferase